MSFSDLKSKSSLSDLQKKLEATTNTSFSSKDERLWTVERDKAGNGYAVIRFLPATNGEDTPFVKLYTHGFQGPGGWYIENSLTTLGQTDPIGEYNRELWNSGDESLREQVRKQKRKLSYYSNIYVVEDRANPDNEGKVFLFRYGKKIFDKIMDVVNGDELENRVGFNPFDLWEGADFKLRVKKVAGYPNYDSSSFAERDTLGGLDDAQLESVWNRQYALQELISPENFKTYDELQKQLDRALGRSGRQDSDVRRAPIADRPDISEQPKFSPNPPTEVDYVPSNSDGDDDPLSYFQSLVDD